MGVAPIPRPANQKVMNMTFQTLTRGNLAAHAASLDGDDYCQEHNIIGVCPECADYERFKDETAYAERLYKMAEVTRGYAPTMATQDDRDALIQWAAHLEKTGSEIFGRLQRQADREARQLEDAAQ